MLNYEVYALKYGERDTFTCQFFYRDDRHDPLTLHYFVWLILGGPHPVLVDTGFLEDDAEARGIRNYVRPSSVVEKVAGVKANAIPMALISHLHYDHWAGHSLFPNAEHWIQAEEVAFWTGPFAATPAFRGSANVPALADLVTLNYANKIRFVHGDHEVLPGIRLYRVGGHTAGLQIVTVETPYGPVGVKVGRRGGRIYNAQPEFDDCARAAAARGVAVKEVWAAAVAAYRTRHPSPS